MKQSEKKSDGVTSDEAKKCIVNLLHSVHDSLLESLMSMEKLLKLFGEDMSWYENWRKEREEKKGGVPKK